MTVSIHAAQAGCDTLATSQGSTQVSFNSRSPSGLRQVVAIQLIYSADVSIHAAQAGCDYGGISRTFLRSVSIHAAQAGCDTLQTTIRTLNAGFNSRSPSGLRQYLSLISSTEREFQFTQPKRAATCQRVALRCHRDVSIHAAQAGCDVNLVLPLTYQVGFNSRSPSGLRRRYTVRFTVNIMFQFTQPKRAATLVLLSM